MYYQTPFYPVNQVDAKHNREAFERAMIEFMDDEMRGRILWHIYRTADVLMRERGIGRDSAVNQATEFVAACVWKGATAPRKAAALAAPADGGRE